MALLEIDELRIGFRTGRRVTPVVDAVSLHVAAGETVCLVGESGSGKSVTAQAVARLLPEPPAEYLGGVVRLDGVDVLAAGAGALRRLRGGVVGYVFQEPSVSLNPVWRVGRQIREVLDLHRPAEAHDAEVTRLLGRVGIPAPAERARAFPHELSGGMQQRVMIALAVASRPKLLIADEPTTALDVTVQAQILDLLRRLQADNGMAILLITHNLAMAADFAHRVAVMYAGQIVEEGPTDAVLRRPRHPYTRALLAAVPALGGPQARLAAIPGRVPTPGEWPAGCRFAPRCEIARPSCREGMPVPETADGEVAVRCPWWREERPA